MTSLVLSNITMTFRVRKHLFHIDNFNAVDNVSLTLNRSETLGIVGESGSGKTTLARIALKLLKPSSGAIRYGDRDISHLKDRDIADFRKKVQGIFQDPFSSLDPYMNVRQILEEPLIIHKSGNPDERESSITRVLQEVKLNPPSQFLSRYTYQLSGGQRQRVAIARSLLLKPEFIVADEPVSMIDASSRAEILSIFAELQHTHDLGFMYITHDIATAGYFCHKIAVMYQGRVVEYGPAKDVIDQPLHPYTANLLEAVPSPDPMNRFRERMVVPAEKYSDPGDAGKCHFSNRCLKYLDKECSTIPELKEGATGHCVACWRV